MFRLLRSTNYVKNWKNPVLIPEKVSVDFEGSMVTVKGPKGELKRLIPEGVALIKKIILFVSPYHQNTFKAKAWFM